MGVKVEEFFVFIEFDVVIEYIFFMDKKFKKRK